MMSGARWLLLLACYPLPLNAQFANQSKRVELVVKVFVDSIPNHAPADITVQLEDNFGDMEQDLKTDSEGIVRFSTRSGLHRIRIYGPGIAEYSGSIDIYAVEIRRVENIVVSALSGSARNVAPPEVTSIARLKVPEKASQQFRKGSLALSRQDWSRARKEFESAIALYPEYDVAYNGLGVALMGSGDTRRARSAFEKAILLNHSFAEAYRNLARIALADHKYQEVSDLLTESLSSDPLNAWALAYSAYSALQMGKFDSAIMDARKAHSVPHDGLASVHIVAALALEATQHLPEAAAEYHIYLKEDPKGRDAERARQAIERINAAATSNSAPH